MFDMFASMAFNDKQIYTNDFGYVQCSELTKMHKICEPWISNEFQKLKCEE